MAVAHTQDRFGIGLVGDTQARSPIVAIRVVLRARMPVDADELQPSGKAGKLRGQWRLHEWIEPIEAVIALRARRVVIVAQAEIQGQLPVHSPVVLDVTSVIQALRGDILPRLIEISARPGAQQ